MDASRTPTQPIASARLGLVSAAAFQNVDDSGKSRGMSVSLTKRFYDASKEQWMNSRCYLDPDQIGAAIAVLQRLQDQLLTFGPAAAATTGHE